MTFVNFYQLATAFSRLPITAQIKRQPSDFQVFEQLGFSPSGQGEHVFLWLEKSQLTTQQVLKELAAILKLKERDISYSGLKDKQALTYQWFSFVWPIKKTVPLERLQGEQWRVLECHRHDKKLRRGVHKSNHFDIILSQLNGAGAELEARLQHIQKHGFANYFGQQRFAFDQHNLEQAQRLFAGQLRCKPFERSLYYSAARSYLFNLYLNQRIEQGNWNQALDGDCFNLAGSNAIFGPEPASAALQERIELGDIHCAGPLLGADGIKQTDQALAIWQTAIEQAPSLYQGLTQAKLETHYRPLRCFAENLTWQMDASQLRLQFDLRTGSFATVLINELVSLDDKS